MSFHGDSHMSPDSLQRYVHRYSNMRFTPRNLRTSTLWTPSTDVGAPPSPTPFQSETQLYAAYRTLIFKVRSLMLVCKGFHALAAPLQYRVVVIRSKDRAHRLQQIISVYDGDGQCQRSA
ncbi:hypothetical protein FA95DRAFT_515038 [Auriscalpium vulgare]|uniref:Uncharacterized protein n=1 Tax=Auriscalpium vulgare TaxID=40419 RepID=A0ACB8RH64_9AGAM|nr:hypothetical protein FA95DRAFT_515038 [Auriscalpium vulgare]